MDERGRNLKSCARFPALAYGTLVAFLAGWKGIQRYRSIHGDTKSTNGEWLIDILIRQVISI